MESLRILHQMTDNNLNRREWNDPKNWSLGLIYRSRMDSRKMVPKRGCFGLTINFGNRNGVIIFRALLALPLMVFIVLFFCGGHFNRH